MNNIAFDNVMKTIAAIKADNNQAIKKWQACVNWKDGVQNEIMIRNFDPFLVDEPAPLGGTDTAPNPVEYLIGASASCFAITFQVLTSQQGIKLEHVSVEIEADLNAAVFLGLEEGNGGILHPIMTLTSKTSATKKQIESLVQLALSKSPVLLSLNTHVEVKIQ